MDFFFNLFPISARKGKFDDNHLIFLFRSVQYGITLNRLLKKSDIEEKK